MSEARSLDLIHELFLCQVREHLGLLLTLGSHLHRRDLVVLRIFRRKHLWGEVLDVYVL